MNNKISMYLLVVLVFAIILVNMKLSLSASFTDNEKTNLDKKIKLESNLPKIDFDMNVLKNITSIKNIKTNN